MKKTELIFVVFFAILFSMQIRAQENLNDEDIFFVVEEMPEYPGGEKAMQKYIADNVQYPKTAKEKGIQGKVFITFIISENGDVKNAKVIRSVDPLIDKEALRVINSLPDWKPGKQKGKAVNVKFTLPINFELDGEENIDEPSENETVIVFQTVEEMPEYPGGEKAMQKYIADNVQYPKTAKEKGIQGKVFITFIISEDGDVKNAKVIRSVDPLIDKEALRVINSMPSWIPGKQRGKKVDVQFTLPINFSLGEEK